MSLIKEIEAEQLAEGRDQFAIGDTIKVHYKIVEGATERIQLYEGVVIARNNSGVKKTITVRKISYGVGVERVFPVHSPKIEKIEVVRRGSDQKGKTLLSERPDWKGCEGARACREEEQESQRGESIAAAMAGIPITKLTIAKAGLYQTIRSGLFLSLRVGKTLSSGKQEGTINGKAVILPTRTGLTPGRTYKLRYTIKKDGSLLIHMPKEDLFSSKSASTAEIYTHQGLGRGKTVLERQVLEIIGNSGLLPTGLLFDSLSGLIKEKKPDLLGRALLSILLGKRILPERHIYEELLPLFSGGRDHSSHDEENRGRNRDGHGSGGEKKEAKPSGISVESIKSSVSLESNEPTLLHLFNALQGAKEEQWIIIPLPEREEKGDLLKGVMRLLIDPSDDGRVKRMLLSLSGNDEKGFHFLFRYVKGDKKPLVSLFLPTYGIDGLQSAKAREFMKKMDNLGFKIDDIQREESLTGFESECTIPDGIDLEA